MLAHRHLGPRLGAFVRSVWTSDDADGDDLASGGPAMDRTLPTGSIHFVFRLSGAALRVAEHDAGPLVTVGRDVIGGPRLGSYLRERSSRSLTVGIQLREGAAMAVLGVTARELTGRHWVLDDVVGPRFASLREQLLEASTPHARLATLEAELTSRVSTPPEIHPAVALALDAFAQPELPAIGALVRETGLSHRRFVTLFERAVGVTPASYRRIIRLQRALEPVARGARPLATVAASGGFSDQAHLTREFRALTGLTPGAYRAARPALPNHVPVNRGGSDPFKTHPAMERRVTSNHEP